MADIHFLGPLVRRGNYYCVEFPRFISHDLRQHSRIRVKGTVNGGDYEGLAFSTGEGTHYILINAALRQKLDLEVDEEVVVILDVVNQGQDKKATS
jgi:hypothetical protein